MSVQVVCRDCGSTDITVNAVGWWSPARQEWDYEHDYGNCGYCRSCEDEGGLEEVPYDPAVWNATFELGDVVRFRKDALIYDYLPGQNKLPQNYESLTGLIGPIDGGPERDKYSRIPDGVVVLRLVTGHLMEAWPHQLEKVEVQDEPE